MSRPEILAAFRDRQVRCTPQLYTILDHLLHSRIHPTAEEIHIAINRRDPRVSLATVEALTPRIYELGGALLRDIRRAAPFAPIRKYAT